MQYLCGVNSLMLRSGAGHHRYYCKVHSTLRRASWEWLSWGNAGYCGGGAVAMARLQHTHTPISAPPPSKRLLISSKARAWRQTTCNYTVRMIEVLSHKTSPCRISMGRRVRYPTPHTAHTVARRASTPRAAGKPIVNPLLLLVRALPCCWRRGTDPSKTIRNHSGTILEAGGIHVLPAFLRHFCWLDGLSHRTAVVGGCRVTTFTSCYVQRLTQVDIATQRSLP